MSAESQRNADLVELHALCSRYMAYTSQFVQDRWLEVFGRSAAERLYMIHPRAAAAAATLAPFLKPSA